jgi:hypothetical protein
LVVLNQGDVDGEFSVALDEFFRAVHGIDNPEPIPALPLLKRHVLALLGQHGNPCGTQMGQDHIMGQAIGPGQRAVVGFDFHVKILPVVHPHDGLASLPRRRKGDLQLFVHRFKQVIRLASTNRPRTV